jgi:hypothetical protein
MSRRGIVFGGISIRMYMYFDSVRQAESYSCFHRNTKWDQSVCVCVCVCTCIDKQIGTTQMYDPIHMWWLSECCMVFCLWIIFPPPTPPPVGRTHGRNGRGCLMSYKTTIKWNSILGFSLKHTFANRALLSQYLHLSSHLSIDLSFYLSASFHACMGGSVYNQRYWMGILCTMFVPCVTVCMGTYALSLSHLVLCACGTQGTNTSAGGREYVCDVAEEAEEVEEEAGHWIKEVIGREGGGGSSTAWRRSRISKTESVDQSCGKSEQRVLTYYGRRTGTSPADSMHWSEVRN